MSDHIIPLLKALVEAGQIRIQTNDGQKSEARLQRALSGVAGRPVTSNVEVDQLISQDKKFSTVLPRRYFRLADSAEGTRTICPIAYLDGDLSTPHPRLCVQLIIVTHTDAQNDKIACLLMRFETPEGGDPSGQGKHDYYHCQLCTDFRIDSPNRTFTFPDRLLWPATSCPAWPMDAKTPLHLLVCVVFALYGKAEGSQILQTAYGSDSRKVMDGMHFAFPHPVTTPPGQMAKKRKRSKKARRRR